MVVVAAATTGAGSAAGFRANVDGDFGGGVGGRGLLGSRGERADEGVDAGREDFGEGNRSRSSSMPPSYSSSSTSSGSSISSSASTSSWSSSSSGRRLRVEVRKDAIELVVVAAVGEISAMSVISVPGEIGVAGTQKESPW